MVAPVIAFLGTPAGQAMLGALMTEAPALFGKLLGIWGKQGAISAEEIAAFIVSYRPPETFYDEPKVVA